MLKRNAWIAAAVAAGLSGVGLSASAADNLWTGAVDNDWNKPANWSLGRVPVNPSPDEFDDAVVNTLTNFPVITVDLAATPRDIIIGSGAGVTARVDHTGGTAATSGPNWFYVAREGGTATYNLANTAATGGTLTGFGQGTGNINVGQRLYVGGTDFGASGSNGTMNVNTSGTLAIGNDLAVGVRGSVGVMNVDAGTITTGGWNFIGKDGGIAGGDGTLNMSGGTLTNDGARTFVGEGNAVGRLNISGGTYNNVRPTTPTDNNTQFVVGSNNLGNAATSELNMSGGTLNVNRLFTVGGTEGFGGDGAFTGDGKGVANVTGSGALINVTGEFWVGQGANSVGQMTVSAGRVQADNWIAIGRNGAEGTLTVTGTGVVEKTGGGEVTVGTGGGGVGVINVGPGGTFITNNRLILAENNDTATGTLNQTGGTVRVGSVLEVQRQGTGTYNLSGGTLVVDGDIDGADGTFAFTGGRITRSNSGAVVYNGNLTVADAAAGFTLNNDKTFDVNGQLTLTSGVTLDVTGQSLPAGSGTGSINLGAVDSIVGTFDPLLGTSVVGLANPAGAAFISEAAGEGGLFNPAQSVYWVQESGGQVDLRYSIAVPEPTSLAFLALGGLALAGRRRSRK
jgi:hypothetical protein